MDSPLFYSLPALDRAAHLRRDDEAVSRLRADPRRRVVPLWRDLSLVDGDRAAILTGTQASMVLDLADEPVFLGLSRDGVPAFAADLSAIEDAEGLGLPGTWVALKATAPILGGADGSLLAYARAILLAIRNARFCGRCGGPTRPVEGGHARQCLDQHCNTRIYPRTDPAIIVLVSDGDRVLLHRQRPWPAGMWSILAGFVEPGETLEQAVAREVHEETGLAVADIAYGGNQPWPFPGSLMIGFTARAAGGELRPDTHEIEDARWFSKQDLGRLFDDHHRQDGQGLFLAQHGTIARRLLERWRG